MLAPSILYEIRFTMRKPAVGKILIGSFGPCEPALAVAAVALRPLEILALVAVVTSIKRTNIVFIMLPLILPNVCEVESHIISVNH